MTEISIIITLTIGSISRPERNASRGSHYSAMTAFISLSALFYRVKGRREIHRIIVIDFSTAFDTVIMDEWYNTYNALFLAQHKSQAVDLRIRR